MRPNGKVRRGVVCQQPSFLGELLQPFFSVEHAEMVLLAIYPKGQRIGRAPAPGIFVEPAKEHAAAALGFGYDEFA